MGAPRLCFLLAAACAACGQGPPPPHVVLLVADDMGWADPGFQGGPAPTPNLDRLAAEGVVLDRFYAFPLCSPTRFALMTGRNPTRQGFLYTPLKPWDTAGVPPEEETLGELLQRGGYETALVGKWHLGSARREYWPQANGFEHFTGGVTGWIGYFDRTNKMGGVDWQRDGVTLHEDGYTTDLIAAEAVRRIRGRDPQRRLFLCVPFTAPHLPLEATRNRLQAAASIADPQRRYYVAMMAALDDAVGGILAALEEEGIAGETLVLFLNDNGSALNEPGINVPLRGGKGSTLEGGIRVPALVRWPGRLDGGRRNAQVMTVMDVLPTLAAACGVAPSGLPLDGENLLPVLESGRTRPRADLFFGAWKTGDYEFAVIDRGWKLQTVFKRGHQDNEEHLYRILEDPYEEHDRAATEPRILRRLRSQLARWTEGRSAPSVTGTARPPDWKAPADWAAAAE